MPGSDEPIEARLAARYGRPALSCPSGRLALYLALTELFEPGGRLLMSPVDDDVVALTVLAAGLRPVMAPIDPADGNVAVAAVPPAVWDTVDGVLTTNLYGLADDAAALRARCDALDLVLVEDVAHALVVDEADGRPVGDRGDAVVVSLSKHGRGRGGGGLLLSGRDRLEKVRRRRDRLLDRPRVVDRLRGIASRALGAGPLGRRAATLRTRSTPPARAGHRMQIRPAALRAALAGAPDLAAADPWVGVDNRRYRARPTAADRRAASAALERAAAEADRRRAGVNRLRELPAATSRVRADPTAPLFRVPLLVADRDRAAAVLAAAGLPLHYVYDPPLDDLLGPEFVDPAADPRVARRWARHALPVDPLHADRFLEACAAADQDVLTPLEW